MLPSIIVRRAHDESIVTPIVCQPADIDKWKRARLNLNDRASRAVTAKFVSFVYG